MKDLAKAYNPKQYEDNIYKKWEDSGLFNPDVCVEKGVCKEDADPYTIVLPPPNVTGTLHMGHAAMLAIEDLMIRYHRMKGDKTLWLPGTDHAAVATESKVEKMLVDEGMAKPKETLGREKFLEKVNKFAQDSHDTIVNQAKKMGSSLDWSREAYTLDKIRNKAVRTIFKKMYDDRLIYRGHRVINWSVKGQSTCSDDELVYVERPAKLYTFKYSKDFPITIATTRPETKLGDTAIAVNPKGKWKKYIGQELVVENFGQTGHKLTLKVIGDDHVDDDFGTGALGVTTAHSPIDFEMYIKQKALGNDIGLIQVIGEDGNMTANAGSEYVGLSVEEARKKVVAWLEKENLLESVEDTVQNAGTSDRFKDVVEPLPKTQWFIDVNKKFVLPVSKIKGIKDGEEVTLKSLMQKVINNKQIEILPEKFNKTYFAWIDNLRDWCISRQIWFGHQIPVWYKGKEIYCDVNPPEGEGWTQDPDSLDTWFSAGIWTFSTLLDGDLQDESWEEWITRSKDFQTYHPTQVLETGYDIIFFWVARMILMTTYTLGDIPFEKVYLHGLVRDENGKKMSKSLGNIINPLDMIDQFGTDATRLSLVIGSTPGNDMKLSEEKIAGYRNFTNKLWNISRFMLMNIEEPVADESSLKIEPKTLADSWILDRLEHVRTQVTDHLENYQFSIAGEKLRDFTWNDLADWYLEIAKIEENKSEILNYILNTLLKLWHPYMPFVTEAIWQEVYGDSYIMVAKWPECHIKHQQKDHPIYFDHGKQTMAEEDFALLKNYVVAIRALRAQYKIDPAKKLSVSVVADDKDWLLIENNIEIVKGLARLESIQKIESKPEKTLGTTVESAQLFIHTDGAIDTEKEKERLQKEMKTVEPYIISMEKKLSNTGFVQNAPKEVIAQEKQKLQDAKDKLLALQDQLSKIMS